MTRLPLTLEQLRYSTSARLEDAERYVDWLNDAMQQFDIN